MKALFLVGGSGTRLRPLTDYLPKPMIPIMGRPLLERSFMRLRECGITEIVLSACYKPEKIQDYFGDGSHFGLKLHYVVEEEPLGTGGAIKNAAPFFDSSFFVFNADILCDVSLPGMLAFHREKAADVTIASTYVADPTPYGVLNFDDEDRIFAFQEKPKPYEVTSHYINAGIYLFEPWVLNTMPAGQKRSLEHEVFPSLLENEAVLSAYRDVGYWMDIGTPEKYVQAHRDIFAGRCLIAESSTLRQDRFIEVSAKVDSSVQIAAPAFIGKHSHLAHDSVIRQFVVVGDNATVDPTAYLEDVIVWPSTHIPAHADFRHGVVAELDGQLKMFPYGNMMQERNVPLS